MAGLVVKPNRLIITNPPANLPPNFVKSLTEYSTYGKWPKPVYTAIKEISYQGKFALAIPRWYPTGKLEHYIPLDEIIYDNDVMDFGEMKFGCNVQPRDPLQAETDRYLAGVDEYSWLQRTSYRVAALETGNGKTSLTIRDIAREGLPTLVTVHKANLLETPWKKSFAKHTNIPEDKIAFIEGKASLKKILKNISNYVIFVAIIDTINSLISSDKELLDEFFRQAKIGIKVCDEAHIKYRFTMNLDMSYDFNKVIYLTATPGRTSYSAIRLFRYMVPPENYWIGREARQKRDPYLNMAYVFLNSKPSDDWTLRISRKDGVNLNDYTDYIMSTSAYDLFYDMILKIVKKFRGRRIAIVCGKLDFIKRLQADLEVDIAGIDIGNYNTIIKKREDRAKELLKEVILTTTKSMDAGDDFDLDVMINLVPMSSEVAMPQIVGRIRPKDNSPNTYFELLDFGFEKVKRNYKNKLKFVRTNLAKQVTEIDTTKT